MKKLKYRTMVCKVKCYRSTKLSLEYSEKHARAEVLSLLPMSADGGMCENNEVILTSVLF